MRLHIRTLNKTSSLFEEFFLTTLSVNHMFSFNSVFIQFWLNLILIDVVVSGCYFMLLPALLWEARRPRV